MSSPCAATNTSESPSKISSGKIDSISLSDEVVKSRADQPPVTNGALPHDVKAVGNGLSSSESSVNGQEEKPISSDPMPREVPDLLPLQPITSSPPPLIATGPIPAPVAAAPSVRQPPPSLLPIVVTPSTTPVVATKSAPPPPPKTTRGQNKTASPASSPSPTKDQPSPSPSLKSKPESEEPSPVQEEPKKRRVVSRKRDSIASSDSADKGDGDSGGDGDGGRKSKRARTQTQPFQSSDMADVNLLRVMKASAQTTKPAVPAKQPVTPAKPVGRPSKESTKTPAKGVTDDKLVVFFKGEFLAVRNAEGGFYVCQTGQDIYRGSHKIKIRWLSQVDKSDAKPKRKKKTDTPEVAKDESGLEVYTPDFVDTTDFECILTNLELEKLGTNRYGLPLEERQRTENILRRAIEVEQGVLDKVELTEEHPDGLDVSLFHDESQLKRKSESEDSDSSDDIDTEPETKKTAIAAVSGASSRKSVPTPEPRSSTSTGASTSSGRGRKRAAVTATIQQKIQQMRYQDDDSSNDEDDDIEDDDSDSEDSDAMSKRRPRRGPKASARGKVSARGKASPRGRPSPAAKPRGGSANNRGKALVTQKRDSTPRTKASLKQTTMDVAEKRTRKAVAAPAADSEEKEDPSSPQEKIVTVDVEMGSSETTADEEPKEIKLDAVMADESEPAAAEKSTEESTKSQDEETKKEVPTKGELKENSTVVVPPSADASSGDDAAAPVKSSDDTKESVAPTEAT